MAGDARRHQFRDEEPAGEVHPELADEGRTAIRYRRARSSSSPPEANRGVVKAKLEAVESKIVAFEEEFMPYIVTASGLTLAEMILPQMDQVCLTGNLPPLLPGPKPE
jgi:hypothetical protein